MKLRRDTVAPAPLPASAARAVRRPRASCCACSSAASTARSTLRTARTARAVRSATARRRRRAASCANWNAVRRGAALGRHRLRRELHRRRLEHAPTWPACSTCWSRNRAASSGGLRQLVGRAGCTALRHLLNRNTRARQPQEHPRALRPRQRVLRAVAGPDDDLLERAVRRRPGARRSKPAQARQVPRASSAQLALEPGRARARDRLRLGRLRRDGRARRRLPRHRPHAVDASSSPTRSERMRAPASRDRVDLQLRDYRDSAGQYDARRLDRDVRGGRRALLAELLRALARSLKPGGRACIQTIVIDDELFERYRKGTDFIQQYIFPGGMLPSPHGSERAARARGPRGRRRIRASASTTPRRCGAGARVPRADAGVRALGFDERFIRIWEFYLAYCEAAFAARAPTSCSSSSRARSARRCRGAGAVAAAAVAHRGGDDVSPPLSGWTV